MLLWGGNSGTDPVHAASPDNFDPDNVLAQLENLYSFYVNTMKFTPETGLLATYKSPTPGTSSTAAGTGCAAGYSVASQWQGGFQGTVTVTAAGTALRGWTVRWTLASGQTVSQSWNATLTTSDSAVTATNVSYNGTLAAGGSTSFGFIGSWTASNPVPALTCNGTT